MTERRWAEAMEANRRNWNARVPVHLAPDGYDLDHLLGDAAAISEVVAFDIDRLGDLAGLDLVHLQCHIGTDTISLGRLGANVTGLDLAEDAVAAATDLAARCDVEARFVAGNVYDAVEVLGDTYDLVYTGVGALNWLPDIASWAQVVASLLRPGGRLHLFEGHPVAWALADDCGPDDIRLGHPYFRPAQPLRLEETSSYLGDGEVAEPLHFEWAHHLSEVIQAVLDAGLQLTSFEEHRVVPWRQFPWFEPVPDSFDWTRLPEAKRDIVPLTYTLQARKPDA
ncbi:MAG: methyltransferase [Actinomycetota bacterium]